MAEDLASRVAKLEADYHRLAAADTFSGQSFELENDDGHTVAAFHIDENGEPSFALLDKNGEERFIVQLKDGRPQLSLRDEDGADRLTLAEHIDRSVGLLILGKYRRNRVLLGFGGKGEPYLHVAGTNGTIDLHTSLLPGWLGLSLADEGNQNRLAVALDPEDHNGSPFIVLTDHRGQQRWWRGK